MYKSPINLSFTEPFIQALKDEQENYIMQAVQRMDVQVNKQELIKALAYDRGQYEKGYYDGVKASKWISVEERLPAKIRASYLCLTDTGYHCQVRWTDNVYGLWESDDNWGWSIADVPQYSKVTHWMLLPEPPENAEEGER